MTGPRFHAAAWTIVGLALCLRLAWLAYLPDGLAEHELPPLADRGPSYERLLIERLTDDQAYYARSAQYLAEGEGYREPFAETVTARWAPGYPLLLAGLFKLMGPDLRWARFANAALGAAAVGLVIAVGARLGSRGGGLAAGAAYAAFPSQVYATSLIMTEALFIAGLLGVVWWALARARNAQAVDCALLGLLLGSISLVRPEAVLLAAALALYWWRAGTGLRRTAAATGVTLIAALAVLAPWTIRNAITLDAFVPLSTGSGGAIIQGHHEDADGALHQGIYDELRARFADVPEPERQVRENREGLRESLEFAVSHPLDEAALVPQKLYHLFATDPGGRTWAQLERWGIDGRETLETAANGYYYLALVLALAGAWLLGGEWKRPGWALIGGVAVTWSLIYGVVYVGDGRYHAPLLPLFTLVASYGVARGLGGEATVAPESSTQGR
jgi:4-amino-4-deoxy-L-arabinose transferase-like glycosyltransferase